MCQEKTGTFFEEWPHAHIFQTTAMVCHCWLIDLCPSLSHLCLYLQSQVNNIHVYYTCKCIYVCVCVYNYCKARKTKFNFMTRRGKSDEILIPCNDCIMFSMRASLPQQIQVLNQMRIIYQVKSLCPKVHCILSESDTDVQSTWAIFFSNKMYVQYYLNKALCG